MNYQERLERKLRIADRALRRIANQAPAAAQLPPDPAAIAREALEAIAEIGAAFD